MRHKTYFCILVILPFLISAQDFDSKLEVLAQSIAEKLNQKEKTKVAIWGFISESKEHENLEEVLIEDFSIYLMNNAKSFGIVDRVHLHHIIKEYGLQAEGYIDEKTTKKLGKFIAAEAIIIGSYTILESEIKVRARVLDTETALQIAGAIETLPMDENIAKLLGKL
ncbi:CsgG/HfaB family protein [Maribacter sp. R77961]|uniref:CsgG/HfaB family protein n=1 Tax=Maribacter sp. R77961 TaxID=3093871 RepID=UPI0037CA35D0